ncbi:MAG: BspA family leucine-rich repeat surface protein [Candidatus Nanoarchaeia archaeon]|nr:BspA family leucine-rich repeat surface protein [Candidatus Nanoarchaeia archaeon]
MKKSVSPLIATVLLIAFTVAIGSVVMNWGTCPTNLENEYNANQFVSVWNTSLVGTGSSASNQIKLPLESSGNYSFTVDWGDETQSFITTWNQEDVTHTYDQEGEYEIKINGTIIGFTFNNLGDKLKIRDIKQWGDLRLGNSGGYFAGTSNLNITAIDVLNLTGITILNEMFYISGISNVSRINEWNVSNVRSMLRMFSGASFFNQDISLWNVSNVRSMLRMFSGASSFNQDISSWNVGNVTNMDAMFNVASSFNQPLDSWDVSNVNSMSYMFNVASSFNQPLDSWDVSNVNSMSAMFQGASSFNQPLNIWNVSNVKDMNRMFFFASSFNQPLDNWDVSSVIDMDYAFSSASSFNQNISNWCVTNITIEPSYFAYSSPLLSDYKPIWGTCPN